MDSAFLERFWLAVRDPDVSLSNRRSQGEFSRREIFAIGGAGLAKLLAGQTRNQRIIGGDDTTEALFPMPEKRIVRPEDLLILDFQFDNLSLLKSYGQPPKLVRTDPSKPCLVTMVFPPQHIQEEVFVDPSHPFTGAAPQASIAGESQIVFQIADADAAAGFPYSLTELLRVCRDAGLRVHPNAPPRNSPDPGAILGAPPLSLDEILSDSYTAIEAPYRLILSPNRYGAWAHALLPRTQHRESLGSPADPRSDASGIAWTEVWHTMLRARPPQGQSEDAVRTVRAIWSPDFRTPAPCDFGALQGVDRQELVKLTGDFGDESGQPSKRADRLSRAVDVDQLALSALGATMKVLYDQTPPVAGSGGGLSLSTWRHEAIMARDQYVKVAYEGYLYPWGHRVSYVQITQRKLMPELSGPGSVSFLQKKYYIIVRQPTNSYRQTNPLAMFPEVAIADGQFEIDPPAPVYHPPQGCTPGVGTEAGEQPFWIMLNGQPYAFDAALTDHNGGMGHFHPGALFVPFGPLQVPAASDIETFLTGAQKLYRTFYLSARYLNFNGQPLAFAPWTANQNTNLQAFHITFDAQHNLLNDRAHLFFPTIQSAEAQVPPLNRLRGTDMQCSFRYADAYLRNNGQGFNGDNLGKVYAELTSPVPLDFSGDLSHGKPLLTARISVIALSAKTVIVGGLASGSEADRVASLNTFVAGHFNANQYFEELQLMQTADLRTLIDTTAAIDPPSIAYTDNGASATAAMNWSAPFNVPKADHITKVPGTLTFQASRQTTLGAGGGASNALTVTNVNNLLDPSADFDFTYSNLRYASGTSQSDFISVGKINPQIRANSELQFAGGFFTLLMNHGFQGGATVENGYLLLQTGVRVPDFDLGVFSLHGLAVSLLIRLGTLVVNSGFEFKIADPNSPCTLTVAMFYGKGYFVLRCTILAAVAQFIPVVGTIAALATLGCSFSLDMSLEFGASVDLHLWQIASLSASISAGIHFELFTDNVIKLVGYFSCHGSLEVLGFGFNVGFDASFEYVFPDSIHVYVNVHVEIDMFFFSIGVDVPIEFGFGGQSLPPNTNADLLREPARVAPRLPAAQPAQSPQTFKQQMTRKDWRAYCDAFA